MKVALYARVSSEKQAEKDLSIPAQLGAMRKYAADHDWDVSNEFVDEAESARTANRPAFKEMIAHVRQKNCGFETILVWKLSRFARNREDSIVYKSLLKKHNVSLISINERVDDTPGGKLFEGMIEVIDEFYSTNLAEDTRRGLRENASRGFCNGGIAPVGYKSKTVTVGANKKTKLEPDEAFAPVVKRIFDMAAKGSGAKEIVNTLNSEGLRTRAGGPWYKTHVYFILKNEVYTGTLVWGRRNRKDGAVRVENCHPALVDSKVFAKVQAQLAARQPKVIHPRCVSSDYLLSGLVYCGQCGATMVGSSAKSSRFHYYACQNYCKKGKGACDAKLVGRAVLEGFVIDRLKSNILTDENIIQLINLTNEEIDHAKDDSREKIAALDGQLGALRGRLSKLYDALETGKVNLEDLSPRIKDLKRQIDAAEREREAAAEDAQAERLSPPAVNSLDEYVSDLKELLSSASMVERRSFIRAFVKRIEVHSGKVTIDYTIPIGYEGCKPLEREVLSVGYTGSPDWHPKACCCGTR
jgi:DNA invertase Pin-like site-specific DNA recombinase/archaellum component FlaC